MNFLNRIVASGEGVTLFSSMTTVLSSEGRDCKFVVRPDDEIGLLALRSTVVVKVALRNPPKRVKDPLKPKVKKTQVKVDEDGNYFRIEVEPTEENVVLTVVPESETSEMEAILATSAATAEEPADSTPSPSQADNVSGVRGPHSKTVPVFRKTTVRIRKTAEKPKPKRMKSLKEKVTAGARAKILRETAQDKKAKWIIQKGSIINSMKKGRALPKKAKVKVIKPVKERKPKASGASTRDPPLLLQHGDRVLLSATEEIIVTLQWKACGFICIGTRDDPPDHVRPTAMSVAPESPIDEFESEEDQASSVVLDDKEMTGLDLDRPDTGALSDDPTVIPTAESTNGLAAPQSLEEGRATLNEAAADENLTEAEIDEQSGDEDREIDMDISDCDGSSDLDFERSTQPVLPIPPEQESTFGVRGPDFHFVRSSPVSNGSMYLKGQCLPTAFDLCRTKFATDEEQNESHATPADSSIRPAQLTTSQPDALPETLPSVVDDMLLDDDERMEVDDAAPASVLDGASGILDDMSRIARDPSSEDFVDDLLLSGVGSDAILPTPLSTSTDNNSPQRALQSEYVKSSPFRSLSTNVLL
ncbi:hypothetical protein CALCODRAFT_213987 [Calocera cornea HHB12733]|uniref:Uncharacterized protein n=1 Tax=Calocera cornea HHB12733 TaxID=1353952 RepID=A0A165HB35_9BASI|nr:hypothetical protein CALCODRAFT_213987 [Calocera cornea HHB12733]